MRLIKLSAIAAFSILVIASAFYEPKCDHVFTMVVQSEIKKRPIIFEGEINPIGVFHNGKEEGDGIICVKCFHRQKQILDYGNVIPTNSIDNNSGILGSAVPLQWPFALAGPFVFDSVTMKH